MPVPLIAIIVAAIAAAGLGAAIVLALLNWDRIIDWFTGREALVLSDKENIAFTLQEKLANGEYHTVQGVFNKGSSKILDGETYDSENIDEKLAEVHRNDELVVYT